jgi:hypothetical protein
MILFRVATISRQGYIRVVITDKLRDVAGSLADQFKLRSVAS